MAQGSGCGVHVPSHAPNTNTPVPQTRADSGRVTLSVIDLRGATSVEGCPELRLVTAYQRQTAQKGNPRTA